MQFPPCGVPNCQLYLEIRYLGFLFYILEVNVYEQSIWPIFFMTCKPHVGRCIAIGKINYKEVQCCALGKWFKRTGVNTNSVSSYLPHYLHCYQNKELTYQLLDSVIIQKVNLKRLQRPVCSRLWQFRMIMK